MFSKRQEVDHGFRRGGLLTLESVQEEVEGEEGGEGNEVAGTGEVEEERDPWG